MSTNVRQLPSKCQVLLWFPVLPITNIFIILFYIFLNDSGIELEPPWISIDTVGLKKKLTAFISNKSTSYHSVGYKYLYQYDVCSVKYEIFDDLFQNTVFVLGVRPNGFILKKD